LTEYKVRRENQVVNRGTGRELARQNTRERERTSLTQYSTWDIERERIKLTSTRNRKRTSSTEYKGEGEN
jgi:hypothetical protein